MSMIFRALKQRLI